MRNELERIQLGHFSVNKNEVYKTTELTGKQRKILSRLKVKAPPTYFEIQLKPSNILTIFTSSISLSEK